MPDGAGSSLWPILHYDDTRAAVRFLVEVLGFHQVVAAADDGGEIVHAELRRAGGGALVLGSTSHVDSVHGDRPAGTGALYVVAVRDEVDAVHRRVREAGGDVVEPPHETRFGSGASSYVFTARDPEGNLWTFGTSAGAPSPAPPPRRRARRG